MLLVILRICNIGVEDVGFCLPQITSVLEMKDMIIEFYMDGNILRPIRTKEVHGIVWMHSFRYVIKDRKYFIHWMQSGVEMNN